jgi:general secretion pathway protein E
LLAQEIESLNSLDFSSQGGWILGAAGSGKSTFFQALLWDLVKGNQEPISFETGLSSNSHDAWTRVELDEEKNQLQAIVAYRGPGAGLVGIDELHLDEVGGYLRLLEGRPALITSQGGAIFSTLSSLERQGIGLGYLLESMAFIISLKLVPGVCPYCCRPHNPQPEELRQIGLKPESLKKPYFVTNDGCEFCENRGYSENSLIYEFLRVTPQVVKILQDNPLGNELAIHLIKLGALVPSNSIAREKLYRGRITLNTYAQILQRKI